MELFNCLFSMRKLENNELERKSIEDFKIAEKTPFIVFLMTLEAYTISALYLEQQMHFN
jgi:hypothetical protein